MKYTAQFINNSHLCYTRVCSNPLVHSLSEINYFPSLSDYFWPTSFLIGCHLQTEDFNSRWEGLLYFKPELFGTV